MITSKQNGIINLYANQGMNLFDLFKNDGSIMMSAGVYNGNKYGLGFRNQIPQDTLDGQTFPFNWTDSPYSQKFVFGVTFQSFGAYTSTEQFYSWTEVQYDFTANNNGSPRIAARSTPVLIGGVKPPDGIPNHTYLLSHSVSRVYSEDNPAVIQLPYYGYHKGGNPSGRISIGWNTTGFIATSQETTVYDVEFTNISETTYSNYNGIINLTGDQYAPKVSIQESQFIKL